MHIYSSFNRAGNSFAFFTLAADGSLLLITNGTN